MYDSIKEDTLCGIMSKVFDNTKEVKEILHAVSMPEFFKALKEKVDGYYESN